MTNAITSALTALATTILRCDNAPSLPEVLYSNHIDMRASALMGTVSVLFFVIVADGAARPMSSRPLRRRLSQACDVSELELAQSSQARRPVSTIGFALSAAILSLHRCVTCRTRQ